MTKEPEPSTRPTVFVISPIGAPGSDTHKRFMLSLDYIVKKALPVDRWEVIRADMESAPDSITGRVIRRIVESDLIVADLSNQNPNVFYELAVAHGYKRPVVHIMQAGQSVPFDVGDQRVIFYDLTDPASVDGAVLALSSAATHARGDAHGAKNPLTEFEIFAEIRAGDASDDAGPVVADALVELSHQVQRLARRLELQESRTALDGTSYGSVRIRTSSQAQREAALKSEYLRARDSRLATEEEIDAYESQLDAHRDSASEEQNLRELRAKLLEG